MDRDDPITQFFPEEENVNLYTVLQLQEDATPESIRKSYRKLAVLFHPDKHAGKDDADITAASTKFQQIGFAYTILSDAKRRSRYDLTGRTDEGFDMGAGDDGWEAYFQDLFESITRGKLDEMKKEYQESVEEIMDLKKAYLETSGSIADIMTHIPHSVHDDEARFIVSISGLVASGDLPHFPAWDSSINDEKSRLVREKQSKKEAKEAEEMAKELGVWDEFYGSGKPTGGKEKRKGKAKAKSEDQAEEEADHTALQALILRKQQKSSGFFDSLAAKYADPEPSRGGTGKGKKKRARPGEGDSEPATKRQRPAPPPEIDDAEFEQLQKKLFGGKGGKKGAGSSKTK